MKKCIDCKPIIVPIDAGKAGHRLGVILCKRHASVENLERMVKIATDSLDAIISAATIESKLQTSLAETALARIESITKEAK